MNHHHHHHHHRHPRSKSEIRYRNIEKSTDPQKIQSRSSRTSSWRLRWSEVDTARAVIPGPFGRARILEAVACQPISSTTTDYRFRTKLRTGIPDPWLEYLTWCEYPSDARLDWQRARLTDYVCNERGLPILQGIPDPWRADMRYVCVARDEANKKKRGEMKSKCKGLDKKKCKLKKQDDVNVGGRAMEKSNSSGAFERLKRRLVKLENELRQKCQEKERKFREMERLADEKKREIKKKCVREYLENKVKRYDCDVEMSDSKLKKHKKRRKKKKCHKKLVVNEEEEEDNDDCSIKRKEEKIKLGLSKEKQKLDNKKRKKEKSSNKNFLPESKNYDWLCTSPQTTNNNFLSQESSNTDFTNISKTKVLSRPKKSIDKIKVITDDFESLNLSDDDNWTTNSDDRLSKNFNNIKTNISNNSNDRIKLLKNHRKKERGEDDVDSNNTNVQELLFKKRYDAGDSREIIERLDNVTSSIEDLNSLDYDIDGDKSNARYVKYRYQIDRRCGNVSDDVNDSSLRIESLTDLNLSN